MTGDPCDDPEVLGTWLRARGRRELAPDPTAIDRIGETIATAFADRSARQALPPEPRRSRLDARDHGHLDHRSSRAAAGSEPASGARRARRARRARPFAAVAFAAALSVASIAGPAWAFASASGPGQPLYGARLAAESIGLPAEGTPERAVAETARLDRRVAEVREESSVADWQGVSAALEATREAAQQLDRALAAAPVARRAAGSHLRDVRQALWAVAKDPRAPRSVREDARRTAELLDRTPFTSRVKIRP